MTTTTHRTPDPEPDPGEVERVLAAIEQHLAEQPPAQLPAPQPVVEVEVLDRPSVEGGETKRVKALRAEVAEAHLLAELQEDDTPILIDSPKVRKRRKKAREAARLHRLNQDPDAIAYRDAKVRRTTTVMVMAAAVIGLAISSIGVQASVATALNLREGTFAWWAAFGVEAGLSLSLLAALAVQAYSAMRGVVVDRRTKHSPGRKMFWAEAVLLALTLTLNCWPAFKPGEDFKPLTLIVHSLGPVGAVIAVWLLPALWAVLDVLPIPARQDPVTPLTVARYSGNADSPQDHGKPFGGVRRGLPEAAHRQRLHELIAAGQLPSQPSARAIQQALGCRTEVASDLRDELRPDSIEGTP